MSKQRYGGNGQRAMQQQIAGGYDRIARGAGELSKAELRASIPDYDEKLVRKIEARKKLFSQTKGRQ